MKYARFNIINVTLAIVYKLWRHRLGQCFSQELYNSFVIPTRTLTKPVCFDRTCYYYCLVKDLRINTVTINIKYTCQTAARHCHNSSY